MYRLSNIWLFEISMSNFRIRRLELFDFTSRHMRDFLMPPHSMDLCVCVSVPKNLLKDPSDSEHNPENNNVDYFLRVLGGIGGTWRIIPGRTDTWLITMVIVFVPLKIGQRGTPDPNGLYKWLLNGGDPKH